jgi:hypothetical protein
MRRDLGLILVLCAACGGGPPPDPGPPPPAGHEAAVRAVLDRVLDDRYRLDGAPSYRFAAAVPGRVARWHFEPQDDGRTHSFGYCHGWCVAFHVRPRYVGYPEQPETARMAFFAGGELRGIFADGLGNAPLELDRWHADWVDETWRPPPPKE